MERLTLSDLRFKCAPVPIRDKVGTLATSRLDRQFIRGADGTQ